VNLNFLTSIKKNKLNNRVLDPVRYEKRELKPYLNIVFHPQQTMSNIGIGKLKKRVNVGTIKPMVKARVTHKR